MKHDPFLDKLFAVLGVLCIGTIIFSDFALNAGEVLTVIVIGVYIVITWGK